MSIPVKRMLRTRGALAAAVTALGVGLAILLGAALVGLVRLWEPGAFGSVLYSASYLQAPVLLSVGPAEMALTSVLPFTVGYFLGFWVIAPITEQLRIGHVLTRAVLATGVGATLWFIVSSIVGVAIVLSQSATALPALDLIPVQLGYSLQQALTGLIVLLPLGVLGGVLLWVRRTAKPSDHHIEGLIDV